MSGSKQDNVLYIGQVYQLVLQGYKAVFVEVPTAQYSGMFQIPLSDNEGEPERVLATVEKDVVKIAHYLGKDLVEESSWTVYKDGEAYILLSLELAGTKLSGATIKFMVKDLPQEKALAKHVRDRAQEPVLPTAPRYDRKFLGNPESVAE